MADHLRILHIFWLAVTLGGSSAQNTQMELRRKEMNGEEYIRLGNPMQRKSIDPSRVIQLSWQPRVFLYRDFLSEEECDYLIYWVLGKRNYTASGGDAVNFTVSMDADDEVTKIIEERISAWTFLPKEEGKSLSVLHFGPEYSKQNYDYFRSEYEEQSSQTLLATVILYLSNVKQGGQILFPQSESEVEHFKNIHPRATRDSIFLKYSNSGWSEAANEKLAEFENKMWSDCTKSNNIFETIKGSAMVLFNLHVNATPHPASAHARCPILQGDLWCATKFFYLKKISTKDDSTQFEGADCTDEDENCPQWAAIGECQRNSIFMIGSPDYYGTCRKSCKVC